MTQAFLPNGGFFCFSDPLPLLFVFFGPTTKVLWVTFSTAAPSRTFYCDGNVLYLPRMVAPSHIFSEHLKYGFHGGGTNF